MKANRRGMRWALSKRWSSRAKRIAKGILGIVVLAAVGRQIVGASAAMFAQGHRPRFHPFWVAASILSYLAGLSVSGFYFGRVLDATQTPVGRFAALRAYWISHLAKYVPGKALVVVVRASLVVPYGAGAVTAGFATLYETLVFMAAGGWLAVLAFGLWEGSSLAVGWSGFASGSAPVWIAAGPAVGFFLMTTPWVFPKIARWATFPFREAVGPSAAPRITWRLLLEGMALSAIAWGFWGLSLESIVRGVSFSGDPANAGLEFWPICTGAVGLATVSGFVIAVAPGGLGVREWVIGQTLAVRLGMDRALIAATALRLAWVAGEVLIAALSFPLRPRLPKRKGP